MRLSRISLKTLWREMPSRPAASVTVISLMIPSIDQPLSFAGRGSTSAFHRLLFGRPVVTIARRNQAPDFSGFNLRSLEYVSHWLFPLARVACAKWSNQKRHCG